MHASKLYLIAGLLIRRWALCVRRHRQTPWIESWLGQTAWEAGFVIVSCKTLLHVADGNTRMPCTNKIIAGDESWRIRTRRAWSKTRRAEMTVRDKNNENDACVFGDRPALLLLR